ncbi:uncharacterized protein LOC141904567 [Tubulanus polymorphus]|uniref:uncharacterized protein LOC141904567 n=1 Tax=Tubulanus polymorphus TaxID=672921 RepID=UPI003DA2EDD6
MVVINGSILLGIAIPAAFLLGLLIIVLILWCRRKRLREKKLRKLEDKKALAALQGKIVAHQLQQQQQQQQQQVEKTSPQRFLYPDNINPVFPGVNPERLRTLSAGTLPLPNRPQSTLNNPTAHWHWKPTNHQWKSLPRPAAAAAAAVGRQRDESEFETKASIKIKWIEC